MSNQIFKVLYLNEGAGEHGRLPDFGTTNMGGVMGPTFYVGGRPLLFADGTPTDGSGTPVLSITLQGVYNVSTPATINLSAGKNFTLNALNNKYFSIDASTGKVTITGDLEVLGASTVVEGVLANVDQVVINPPNPSSTALIIEPKVGVTMTQDLVMIKPLNAVAPTVRVDKDGNLIVSALLNGVNFTSFFNTMTAHVTTSPAIKHKAFEIQADGPFTNITGSNLEQNLASIDTQLSAVVGAIKTHEHVQALASAVWTIVHGKNSLRPTVTIYDTGNYQVLADEVRILDNNTIEVLFNTSMAGRAIILLF